MRRTARLTVLGLVIVLALVTALESPASARTRHRHRHRPKPIVQIEDTASLSDNGQTADVVLTVRCAGFSPTNIRVTVQQGGVTGVGNSGTDYTCGAQRRVVVPVNAASGNFHKGSAVASAKASFHSGDNSRTGSTSRGIQLV